MKPCRSGLLVLVAALLLGCGHVVYKAPNHGCRPFDFENPPRCDANGPAESDDGLVGIRYLGAGGLAIRWQGQILLTAPFFSNYGFSQVFFGWISPDEKAIREGMAHVPAAEVGAILAGHSHYDHLGDLPVVARDFAPRARVYVNDSGVKLLKDPLRDRVESIEARVDQPVQLRDAAGRLLPFRVAAVRSEHAPHVFRFHGAGGQVKEPVRPWSALPVRHLRSGTPLAFVIDLLDEGGRAQYRIYYQDSASGEGMGEPPDSANADGHGYDLAVLCIASHNWVKRAPEALLDKLEPRHVLVIHYEDFFQGRDRPVRFVPLLTDGLANRYLRRAEESLSRGTPPEGPVGRVCGPSGAEWTMPLPGEEVRFRLGEGGARPPSCSP